MSEVKREDLPRCETCEHWSQSDYPTDGSYGVCHEPHTPMALMQIAFGCIYHTDFDEKGKQDEQADV